jgi:predicted transcriptional regulator
MAISGGKTLWSVPIVGHTMIVPIPYQAPPISYYLFGDIKVYASGDKVYVFHDYNETIIDENGTVSWNIGNVTDPAAVDGLGHVYCVRSIGESPSVTYYPYSVYMPDYREPSSIIDAYYPNGTLYWENYTADHMVRPTLNGIQADYTLPLYYNGLLYGPLNNGVTSMYSNGTVKWTKTYDPNLIISEISNSYYERMVELGVEPALTGDLRPYITPFDSKGDIYLQSEIVLTSETAPSKMLLITIGPDGNEISRTFNNSIYQIAKNGIGYGDKDTGEIDNTSINYPYVPHNLTSLDTDEVIAFNVSTGEELWDYPLNATPNDTVVTTIDENNVRALVDSDTADEAINDSGMNLSHRPRLSNLLIVSQTHLQVSPGNNIVYVYYQTENYDNPIVLGESKCAYFSALYAFSLNGTLLWSKPIPLIQPIGITNNGTMFYKTPDGKIGVTNTGIAATGFTLTILIYLFLRFFCVGAVARAKASLNKNEKRNQIYDYIVKNPGLTIYELARGTNINMGTIRYHVFILGMNHKITSYKTDGKYIRYFTNSNSYSREDQLILSIMRRDAIGKVLRLLLDNPCMTNAEISRKLNINESVVNRSIKELSEKGIITREPSGKKCLLDDVQREHINMAIKHINGE